MTVHNPAVEAELARLIADQEADDGDRVRQGDVSLDASFLTDGSGSFHEVVSDDVRPTIGRPAKRTHCVTSELRGEWRWLRKKGWTYQRIADHSGFVERTVRKHLSRGDGTRVDSGAFQLASRLDRARKMYEDGAILREIAEVLYEECGYHSWASCYQGLRKLFHARGIPLRQGNPNDTVVRRLQVAQARIAFLEERIARLEERRAV